MNAATAIQRQINDSEGLNIRLVVPDTDRVPVGWEAAVADEIERSTLSEMDAAIVPRPITATRHGRARQRAAISVHRSGAGRYRPS